MKDTPHHMANFIKNFTKEESPKSDKILHEFDKPKTKEQIKKQAKEKQKKIKEHHVPHHDTPDEQNKKQKKRTPKIRERAHKSGF